MLKLPRCPLSRSVFTSTTEMATSPNPTTMTICSLINWVLLLPCWTLTLQQDCCSPVLSTLEEFSSTRFSRAHEGLIVGPGSTPTLVNTRPVPGFITFPRIVKRRRRSSSSVMTTRKLTLRAYGSPQSSTDTGGHQDSLYAYILAGQL